MDIPQKRTGLIDHEFVEVVSVVLAELGGSQGYVPIMQGQERNAKWDWWFIRPDTPSACIRHVLLSFNRNPSQANTADLRVQVAVEGVEPTVGDDVRVFDREVAAVIQLSDSSVESTLRQHWPGWVQAAEALTLQR